jgi:transcriptional regulator with XRE-family HTH domain
MPSHLTVEVRRHLAEALREGMRAARHFAELSQEKMAERIGMGATAYGRYERGSGSLVPSVSTLRRMYREVRDFLEALLEPELARLSRQATEPSSGRRRSTPRRRGPPSRARRAPRLALLVDLE